MLYLQHDAPVRLVDSGRQFCNYAIESRSLKAAKPIFSDGLFVSGRCEVNRSYCRRQQEFQFSTSDLKRFASKILMILRKQVEEDY